MATEVGLLTCGSSYSPTPSQPPRGQRPALLAFVPAYSGASVRDLHPLPVSLISIARIAIDSRQLSSGTANVKSCVWYIRESAPRMCIMYSATLRVSTFQGKPRGDAQVRPTLTVRASGVAAQRMTSSAWERRVGAIVRPRACAVWRLITSSTVVGCSMGRSPGFAPLRIFPA